MWTRDADSRAWEALPSPTPTGSTSPTIYATLDLGLVRRFAPGGAPQLYDARTEPHQHVACLLCGRVEDIDADVDAGETLAPAESAGFSGPSTELVLQGK